ncbi:Integrator complex subunit 10 [Trachymyrmex septentrionalis]|uniref:Integrator complex subunit 10 n=1 Tax=Trachymyrmex septentrionalis TaxID=34720 RepID=A0A195EQK9_9HYME|nr:PREDICTED: integrator complex subunit 10 [Trachymyrmex septentrionalis]KYN30461.1 Integrator complex subunit 10 [Trachymyrmex septentrionalis]
MLEKPSGTDNQLSKEDYLIMRAKKALPGDIYAAKSWLITAKSLFPHSAKVQFEAYRIEKLSKNVKEAAKCFSEIFQNFPDDRDIWKEIETVTTCLRLEQCDSEAEFLCEMFQHIPQDLQHRLLVMTADHSEDTMEHCKLLLLLLRKFPQTIATHGPRLVETLLTAEKHSHPGRAVNGFRRLLACETLPLLGDAVVELNPRLSLRLLCKAVEFYLAYIQQPQDTQIQNPWDRLFQIMELMGKKLGWELSSLFAMPWNRETYSDRLQQYAIVHSTGLCDEPIVRQLLMCTIVVLLRILNEHNALINNEETVYCLVEAFGEEVYSAESKLKKRKRDDNAGVVITSDSDYNGSGLALAVKLWDLLHSSDYLQREITKLNQQLRLDNWLNLFLTDLAIYKGLHHEVRARLLEGNTLATNIRLACTSFFLKDYQAMLEYIVVVTNSLPTTAGKISHTLTVPSTRHLHYLTLARFPILQYCCKLLLLAIKENFSSPGNIGDLSIGHALVLIQIDWPQEANLLTTITERILNRGSFIYPLFQSYIICIDILEELTYLWSDHGGGVSLDITTGMAIIQNRRVTTRGADKGVREEFKQAMRQQAARDGTVYLDELLEKFIINEQNVILHSLGRPQCTDLR